MKINLWIARLIVGAVTCFPMLSAQAGAPLWTFTPLTATTIIITPGGSATIQYLVTNNSTRTHRLVMTPMTGITQTTTSGNCSSPFTLGYLGSCVLTLQFNASALPGGLFSGPVVCDQGSTLQCYQPSLADSLNITVGFVPPPATTLTASVSVLALSVNNTGLNAALTGTPRIINITNTGAATATNVNYSISPALPGGTSIVPASCGNIGPGAFCALTIIPGGNPTTTASVVTVQGDNTNAVAPSVNILTYGTIYESGFVFSVNDTTPTTSSVGGTVAALVDQTSGIIWSSNSGGSFDGGVSIFGIDETSTTGTPSPSSGQITGQSPCKGNSNGSCDSINILLWYSVPNTSPSINPNFYAAGLCALPITGFNDWYLPSICEEGYDQTAAGTGCGLASSPLIQNMQRSLVDNVTTSGLTGTYWSSTEYSATPISNSWSQTFATGAASSQAHVIKSSSLAVRCARALT